MSNFFVGKTITGMKIATDKEALLIQCTDGDHIVKVDADCCSHTWIEHIELPALGFPALVTAVEDLDLNKEPTETDGDYIQFYGCKIVTDRGEIVIDYRNSSNGYYGGSITWPDDTYHYGGVYGQNNSKNEWTEIQP
jgi:hypothetical protein